MKLKHLYQYCHFNNSLNESSTYINFLFGDIRASVLHPFSIVASFSGICYSSFGHIYFDILIIMKKEKGKGNTYTIAIYV